VLYDKMSERRPVWKDEFRQTDMCLDRRPTSCLLLAFYEQVTERLDLHCFLCQSAAVTTADRQTVSHERAFDAPLFAHLHIHRNGVNCLILFKSGSCSTAHRSNRPIHWAGLMLDRSAVGQLSSIVGRRYTTHWITMKVVQLLTCLTDRMDRPIRSVSCCCCCYPPDFLHDLPDL